LADQARFNNKEKGVGELLQTVTMNCQLINYNCTKKLGLIKTYSDDKEGNNEEDK
jgi:hypothetical protein